MHVGQAKVATRIAMGQFRMVHPEQMQHRGVQIVNRDRLVDRSESKLVGFAVSLTAFDAAAGQHVNP